MGKKSRSNNKRSSKKQGNNSKNGGTAAGTTNITPASLLDRGIYQTYKQCTQAVKDWGVSTWTQSIGKQQRKKKGARSTMLTLTAVVERLLDLAKAGIAMPPDIAAQLRTAIHLRKRASEHYQHVPSAKESDLAGHAWILHALRKVRQLFQQHQQAGLGDTKISEGDGLSRNVGGAFDALSLEEDSDVSLMDDEELSIACAPTSSVTSEEDLLFAEMAEERCFAIACVLSEVTQTRSDVRDLWKTWAASAASNGTSNANKEKDAAAVGELVAASVSTRYALQMLQTTILQTSVLFPNSLEDFQQILQAFRESSSTGAKEAQIASFKNNDCVTLHGLQKTEMNGMQGTITTHAADNFTEGGRYPVKLDTTGKGKGKNKIVLIKPDNLVRSDDTFFNLNQVYVALSRFDLSLVPEHDQTVGQGNLAVKAACAQLIYVTSIQQQEQQGNKGLASFLEMFISSYLPIWISYAEYGGDAGAADALMRAYLREFHQSKQIKFHMAFAILVMADCASESRRCSRDDDDGDVGRNAMELVVRTLGDACKRQHYETAIQLFEQEMPTLNTDGLHCHYDVVNQYRTVWYPICDQFPWMSGEMLLKGLQMNLVTASGLPYQRHQEDICLIHLYWLLRSEGHLAPIPKIEDTVIRMYRKNVWFRVGLPEKGMSAYLRNWQLALGVKIDSYQQLIGKTTGRIKSPGMHFHEEDKTGLHVTEISRLLDLIQWRSLPVVARKPCFEEVRKIAMEECPNIFLAPLMEVSVKLWRLESRLVKKCLHLCERFVSEMAPATTDFTKVCFWAFSLGDGCAPGGSSEEERRLGMFELAQCFRDAFPESHDQSRDQSASSASLEFNPNNHKIDPSLWGEKGAKETSYASIL